LVRIAAGQHDKEQQRERMDQSAHNFSTPEVLETIGRQLGVAHCMLDVAVAQVSLQCPGIMPLVGEGEAAGMPQHMRVSLEADRAVEVI
jgi:hypothetical protein